MKVLVRNFGAGEFTKDRMLMIWNICSDLPDENFGALIRFFMETKPLKYPPLPVEFREQANAQRKVLNQYGPPKDRGASSGLHPASASTFLADLKKQHGVALLADLIKKRIF